MWCTLSGDANRRKVQKHQERALKIKLLVESPLDSHRIDPLCFNLFENLGRRRTHFPPLRLLVYVQAKWRFDFSSAFWKGWKFGAKGLFNPSKGTLKVIAVSSSAVQQLIRRNTTAIAAADDDCIFAE